MKLKLITLTTLLFLFSGCLKTQSETNCAADEFFQTEWDYQLNTFPMFASRHNIGERHNKLFEDTPENVEKEHQRKTSLLKDAEMLLTSKSCTTSEKENLKLFIHKTKDSVEAYEYKDRYIVFQPMWGPHTWMPQMYKRVPLKSLQNYKDYLERLSQVPDVFERAKVWSSLGAKEGITPPKVTFKNYDSTFTDVINKSAEESPFYLALKEISDEVSEEDKKLLRVQVKDIITNKIIPAYQSLYKFWKEDYYPKLRTTIAAKDLPNGMNFYNYRVRSYTTLDYTAQEIHEIGLKEVSRLLGEMKEVKASVGFKGDLKAFFKDLRTNPKFYAKTKDELLKEALYLLKVMDSKLPKLFKKLPRQPYGIEPIPDYIAHKSPAAYYQPGSAELSRVGVYQINLSNLSSRPLYNLEALSFHEAVPGHHLQTAIAQEIEGVPKFRKYLHTTAFIEGWGLYSESLGKLVGMYSDPYSDFGRLTYAQWRAMRLVVDTGIHAMGWPRDKAIAFMTENSGLSVKNITTEVDRYINWPGQALAYKMGALKIKELRAHSKKELGSMYDIRDFHDVVLSSGAIPLKVLEDNVNAYIKETLLNKKKES